MERRLCAINFLSVKVFPHKKVNMDGEVIIRTENVPIRWRTYRRGSRGSRGGRVGRGEERKDSRGRGRGEGGAVLGYAELS